MNNKQYLPPPWMMYPEIPQGSIGWRMGYGESYIMEYYAWKAKLTPEQAAEYDELFPAPLCWSLSEYNLKRHNTAWTYWWMKDVSPLQLKQRHIPEGEHRFLFFWGHQEKGDYPTKACLSQWYPAKFRVGIEQYNCAEQYMMAKKANLFQDERIRKEIMETESQGKIKALGGQVKGFQNEIWDEFKLRIVMTGNYYKFAQNKAQRRFLLETGDKILVEASPLDRIWGIGLAENDPRALEPWNWLGENQLGFALMEVRSELKRVWGNEDLIDWEEANKQF